MLARVNVSTTVLQLLRRHAPQLPDYDEEAATASLDEAGLPLPLDPHARRFLGLVEAVSRDGAGSEVEILRRATRALAAFAAPPPPVERLDREFRLPGRTLAARAYAPLGAGSAFLPGLIYFHGGGGVSGGLESHDAL